MMPYSVDYKYVSAMIQQPRVPSSGLMPASDVLIRANEVGNVSNHSLTSICMQLLKTLVSFDLLEFNFYS